MLFNSFEFLWLFPLVFLVYYAPILLHRFDKFGNVVLLLISYGLYLRWKPVFVLVLLWVTLVTYGSALAINSLVGGGNKRKSYFVGGLILVVLPLLFFKYYNFINSNLCEILSVAGLSAGLPGLNWALPLGLSFYTFQAIGYLADVYKGTIRAERNLYDYMLFVAFFPQIASGPINKAQDLMPQIKAHRSFNYGQAVEGLRWVLWGMFMKVVMADRIGIYVDNIFNNYEYQSGLSCWLGSFLYTLQIYGDFAGYSFMAVGVGKLLGFELINNFRRPYFSQSVTEFWHRWHISLSSWLRDYIYIPLGGSRCGKTRNYWNIFVTFLVSGIWHGANWTFIVWGMMHGVFQIVEKMLGLQRPSTNSLVSMLRIIITFFLINLAWVFFRMPSLEQAFGMVTRMFTDSGLSIATITPAMFAFCVLSVSIVFLKDVLDEFFPRNYLFIYYQHRFVRWTIYVILLCLILTCGVFDSSQFIYVNF